MAVKKFIRNEEGKIIGTRDVISYQQYSNLMDKYEKELRIIDVTLKYKKMKKDELRNFLDRKQYIIDEIKNLKNSLLYDHFSRYDFNAHVDKLSFEPIMSEEQKERQKNKTFAYNLVRKRKRDNVMITLSEDTK